jgi:hypothetical protein
MKYTRKEIIKKACLISLPLFTPALITALYNNSKSGSNEHLTFEEENKKFVNTLEEYAHQYAKSDLELVMMIINDESIKDFDFVFLTYNRDIHDAPHVAIPKNEDYHQNNMRRLNADVKILKNFAHSHGIFIYHENYGFSDTRYNKNLHEKLIKRIRECGDLNQISDDLFRPVSFVFAELYRYEHQQKVLT